MTFPAALDTFADPRPPGAGQFVWLDGTIRDKISGADANILVAANPDLVHSTLTYVQGVAIQALEAKVGITNSTDPASLDYKTRPHGRTALTTPVTMTDNDGIMNVSLTLPAACAVAGAAGRTPWKEYTIKDSAGNASTHNITYTPASGTIDGMASILIQQDYDSLTIYSDGINEFTK